MIPTQKNSLILRYLHIIHYYFYDIVFRFNVMLFKNLNNSKNNFHRQNKLANNSHLHDILSQCHVHLAFTSL